MCNGNLKSGIENQRMLAFGFKYRILNKKEKNMRNSQIGNQ